MSSHTCSLCGLKYPVQSLLDLHIREDHAQRAGQPAAPAAAADTPPPAPPPAPAAERLSWAETVRRALNRMLGREPADRPRRAA
jgi:hypothetical protein